MLSTRMACAIGRLIPLVDSGSTVRGRRNPSTNL